MQSPMAARTVLVIAVTASVAFALACAHPSKATQSGDATSSDSGKLPADILCSVYGSDHCEGAAPKAPKTPAQQVAAKHQRSRRQDDDGGNEGSVGGVDQDQICEIFGGPSCPPDKTKVYTQCDCPDGAAGGCQCVPYYQCDNVTGQFNQDGVGLINIRQNQGQGPCPHYMQQCCIIREGGAPGPDPGSVPDPNPSPDPGPGPAPDPSPRPSPGGDPSPAPLTQCGLRNRDGVGSRILGLENNDSQLGEISWMVAILRKRQSDKELVCGGGIIAPTVVLTAAHCINDKSPQSLTVRAGEWDSRTESEAFKHQDRDVAEIVTHPDYKEQSLHNDVGLLILSEPIRLGYHIGTICLPDQGQSYDFANCIVSGWGKDKFGVDGVYSNILRRIEDIPVVPNERCQEQLRHTRLGAYFRLNRSFMCAGGVRGKDACTGDGGSPLACPLSAGDDAQYVFTGIVAWGVGCGEQDVPGVYANVALFRNWIDDQMADRQIGLQSRSGSRSKVGQRRRRP